MTRTEKSRRGISANQARRIVFHSVATHLGGAERSLLDLVARIEEASEGRYVPWVLLPKAEGELVERLRRSGVPFGVEPMPAGLLGLSRGEARRAPTRLLARGLLLAPEAIGYLRGLEEILRRERASLVHTSGLKCHALAALAGRRSGTPVLWHLRDILEPGPAYWGLRALERFSRDRVHLVANSGATAEAFLPGSSRTGRIEIVHNGLDPREWAPGGDSAGVSREGLREKFGVRRGELLVGTVGVLARWKGQKEFLGMARRLLDRGAPVRFVVVGGEIYDTAGDRGFGLELREEARRLELLDRVFFTGHVSEPGTYLRALDIAVHASLKPEPFGRVIVEAMAVGIPLVAARGGGVPEIVEDGRTALLHAPGDVEGLAREVGRLVTDPRLREDLARRARKEFERRFTVDRYVKGVVGIYDRLFSH